MPSPVSQVQSVLDTYTRKLRARIKLQGSRENLSREDSSSIPSEGKRRDILDRIGDAAVRAYKKTTLARVKLEKRDQ